MSKVIKVSDDFWQILHTGHMNMNTVLKPTGKKVTFIDYTQTLSQTLNKEIVSANKNILLPIPRGRRVKVKKLDKFQFKF